MRPEPIELSGIVDKVVQLRVEGYSVDYISKSLSISINKTDKILDLEMRTRFADRENMRKLVAMRYEYLIRPLMERYLKAGLDVDRKDAEVLATLLRDQRRLFALDDPVKLEVHHVEELSDEELYKELQMHTTQVKQLAQPDAVPAEVVEAEVINE